MTQSKEQRHFTRIPFNTSAIIINSNSNHQTMAELVDISFKGVLIRKPTDWQGHIGEHYTVFLQLAGDEVEINLAVTEVHAENDHIGFQTEHMDIDSATNLRRLVELNLGDESLLEREFSELVHTA
ncbi:MAG: PilZ domain-containing protein [Gammaproteobacteria bacterium]|nr:PilZ domain-containing protein [Gammaproteobacteria bacterium]MCW8987831.1 PilZ domain-containing protein [Gammaproteobacteria bacterium]MCW9030668.1 PilZ domain-containing protein [Gammaproteobacteria bacterium]